MDLSALTDLTTLLDAFSAGDLHLAADQPGAAGYELAQATKPDAEKPDTGKPGAGKPDTGGAEGSKGAEAKKDPAKSGADRKVIETDLAGGKPSADDFSIPALIARADWVVKSVLMILVVASIWSWAVIFEKLLLLRRINGRATRFENRFWSGGSVDDLYTDVGQKPNNPMAAVFAAAMREWKRSTGEDAKQRPLRASLGDRIDRVMQVTLTREMTRSERFLSSLATIGSTAPFVGLFGTVWGIMRAFQDIATQKNTNLTTVAPGIAEALFATALGLVAAIPAVVAYNKLSGDLDRYAHRLEGFSGEFSAIVSRELDNSGD